LICRREGNTTGRKKKDSRYVYILSNRIRETFIHHSEERELLGRKPKIFKRAALRKKGELLGSALPRGVAATLYIFSEKARPVGVNGSFLRTLRRKTVVLHLTGGC